MEPIMEIKPDTITVLSEPGALTFATRKEWVELPETALEELQNQNIIRVFKGKPGSIFFLLYNNNAVDHFSESDNRHLLVKLSSDEDKNQRIFCISLSSAEVAQLRRNWITIWD